MTTIYLSSTYQDLKEYRTAVFEALRQSGYHVIAMEDYVARDDRPVAACMKDVDRADIYVGLFAFRYGYVPPEQHENPDSRSITELEYRRAEASCDTRCLVFVADDTGAWPLAHVDSHTGKGDGGRKIQQLREELSREKLSAFFTSPYQLASKVQAAVSQALAATESKSELPEQLANPVTWDVDERGSPYPGLMHFTREFAPVFFGRDAEVRELLDRLTLADARFLIVSGASGSGKSSLVDAGVLPALERISGDGAWQIVRMVPSGGADPFDALMRALRPLAERAGLDDYQLARDLAEGREELVDVLGKLLTDGLEADRLLIFLDQMEELYTADRDRAQRRARLEGVDEARRANLPERFLSGLFAASQTQPVQVIATIRSDLLHHCYSLEHLVAILSGRGHYALGRVAPHNLYDMIVRPARCAGVGVPESLARRLIEDLGTESGNLPLLAFALQRLFDKREANALSEAAYQAMGGLSGAIGEHVGDVERRLAKSLELDREGLEALLASLFEHLVRVDIEGLPTRRRQHIADLAESLSPLVETLIRHRLLMAEGEGEKRTVAVAHERLFEAWPALSHWVAENQDELRMLRQGELDAREWHRRGHDFAYLWHATRLKALQDVIERLEPERTSSELRAFAWPQQALVRLLDNLDLDHESRDSIGRCLAVLGDPRPGVGVREDGTPDIDWVAIPGGEVQLEGKRKAVRVKSFQMARYLITNAQFEAFIEAEDGYGSTDWWEGMPEDANDGLGAPSWSEANRPRESVSWYEAVAFCRWLSRRLGMEVRLPIEHEWQQAATGGEPGKAYPWGNDWDARYCNTAESGLNRTTAVGLFPAGASAQSVLDLSGNLWEWCSSKRDDPMDSAVDASGESRGLRGGSWGSDRVNARADFRNDYHPNNRHGSVVGFRVVSGSPIH